MVDAVTGELEAAGHAAHDGGGFQQCHFVAAFARLQGCEESGRAGTEHDDATHASAGAGRASATGPETGTSVGDARHHTTTMLASSTTAQAIVSTGSPSSNRS